MNLLKIFLTIYLLTTTLSAEKIEHLHFLIPGGLGGGWDNTARSVGTALKNSQLINSVSFENMSGDGGGKAISYFIETAKTQQNSLMVNSTPIVIRSLQKTFPHSFRDLTLIASVIADYQVLAVKSDSPFKTWRNVIDYLQSNQNSVKIGGGSSRGGMDHLVATQIFTSSSIKPNKLHYLAYDAGGKALSSLLQGDIDILSTGLGEVLREHKKGNVRILGVTSIQPIEEAQDIPTFISLGSNVNFANWRGFFGAPGLDKTRVTKIQNLLEQLLKTQQWEKIRKRNGWNNLYKKGEEFESFLKKQEESIGSTIKEMGVL